MDANRYFEQMHQVMSAQKRNFSLILSVKVQDLGGADAYIELRRNASGRARVFYSTMGRRNLNFQLFRKGCWTQRTFPPASGTMPLTRLARNFS